MTETQILFATIGVFISAFGLLLNAFVTYQNTSSRKLSNYQEIIKSHRDIWKITIDKPDVYSRIFLSEVDLQTNPITYQEQRFVEFVLLHASSTYNFSKKSALVQIEQFKYDVDDFLSFPIPQAVWTTKKHFYNKDFVKFIDTKPKFFFQKLSFLYSWFIKISKKGILCLYKLIKSICSKGKSYLTRMRDVRQNKKRIRKKIGKNGS